MPALRPPLFLLLALAFAAPAHGLAILADDRFVEERHRDECGGPLIHDTTEPEFLAPLEHPRQASSFSIDPDGLGFSGNVRGGGTSLLSSSCEPLAEVSYDFTSVFDITFRIDGDGAWMTASGGVDDQSAFGLSRDGMTLYIVGDGPIEVGIVEPLALPPGEYQMEVGGSVAALFHGRTQFDLYFVIRDSAVPIPEPATALLIAAGLALLRRASS